MGITIANKPYEISFDRGLKVKSATQGKGKVVRIPFNLSPHDSMSKVVRGIGVQIKSAFDFISPRTWPTKRNLRKNEKKATNLTAILKRRVR